MENIYCVVFNGVNSTPFYLLPTNFEKSEDNELIVGVTSNMCLVIVDSDNQIVYDSPAPEELRCYADRVKEFKRDPLWKLHLKRYFGKPQHLDDSCL